MSFSPAFLDELKMRITLSSVIGRNTKLQKAGREWKACCPFHKEKTPSFTVNDEKGFYHCFGCGAHGDAIKFITETRGLSFVDAVKELADNAGIQVPAPDPVAQQRQEKSASLRDVMEAAARWYGEQLHSNTGADARAYLEERGIAAATQRAFGLGFAPDARGKLEDALKHFDKAMLFEAGLIAQPEDSNRTPYDRFRNRLMFPIRDRRGRVIAFSGRIIGDGKPKYLNSPDTPIFDKGRELYNLDRAAEAARAAGRIIVVEGQMDVIALDQAGFGEAVAPLGTAVTENQLTLLWRVDESPIFCFDGDSAGKKAAMRALDRALPELQPEKTMSFVVMPSGMDPDDVIRQGGIDGLCAMLASPLSLDRFVWDYELAYTDKDDPTSRAKLRETLRQFSNKIEHRSLGQEIGRELQSRFWDRFGWKKDDRKAVHEAIKYASISLLGDLKNAHLIAILFGLTRFPNLVGSLSEQISEIEIDDNKLRDWRDLLVQASFDKPSLDMDVIEAILADGLDPAPIRSVQKHLGYSFFYMNTDDLKAASDLEAAVRTLISEKDIDQQLASLSEKLRTDHAEGQESSIEDMFNRKKELFERKERLKDVWESLGEAAA